MTREAEMDAWTLFREVRRALRASGMQKPYWRVFKRELPRCGTRLPSWPPVPGPGCMGRVPLCPA
jgi:hypothetical protein